MTGILSSIFLMAPAPSAGGQGGFQQMLPTLLMFGAVIVIMYFMVIRPQQKRQKEHNNMLASIKKGDKVITASGIHGTVVDSDEKTYTIQIADNARVKFEKASIGQKL